MNSIADVSIAVLVFATLATAWSWLGSYARIVSFGHAVFFGIGAYAVAVSNLRGGSPWYGALGGALGAVLVATVCGLVCLRGRGFTFTLVTLLAGIAAAPFVAGQAWVGPHDAFAFPVRIGFLNLQFAQPWPYVSLASCVFAVAQGVTFGLRATRTGTYLRALRTNLGAARSVGIDALPPRLLVLSVSAFVTSVAGSFFAEYHLMVAPGIDFALGLGFDIALIGAIGGPRSPWQPALAGLLYALVARAVPLHPSGFAGIAVLVAEGAAILLIAAYRPDGLFVRATRRRVPLALGAAT